MINYNTRDWFKLIFTFKNSDTFRVLLPSITIVGLFSTVVVVLEQIYIRGEYTGISVFHQICGFIISLVLVFRINTAYDRWWEGRKQWGQLVNASRNLAIKMNGIIPVHDQELRKEAHLLISNFPFVLKEHLRNNEGTEDVVFSEFFKREEFNRFSHKPSYVCSKLTDFSINISSVYTKTPNDYLVLSAELSHMMEICGACERIKNTPIPYSYSMYIKKIIFIYIATMPLAFGLTIGYIAIPVVMILFYAFAALELISEEIEDPFGKDANDLPTDEMAVRIKSQTLLILMPDAA